MKRLWKIWADVDTWLGRDGFLTRDRLTGQPIQRNKIAYPETFPDVTISLEYGRKAPLDQVRKDCVLAVVWKHHLAIVLVNEDVVLVNDSSGWWNEIYWKLEAKERIWGRLPCHDVVSSIYGRISWIGVFFRPPFTGMKELVTYFQGNESVSESTLCMQLPTDTLSLKSSQTGIFITLWS